MKAARNVVVTVVWGYDGHDCPMARRTWGRIIDGHNVRRVEPYWYEGGAFRGRVGVQRSRLWPP